MGGERPRRGVGSLVRARLDDLGLGDPALDLAILLGPLVRAGRDPIPWLGPRPDGFRTRFARCVRAGLLEEVVDWLADWVEAERVPGRVEEVRARTWRAHRAALDRYEALFDP